MKKLKIIKNVLLVLTVVCFVAAFVLELKALGNYFVVKDLKKAPYGKGIGPELHNLTKYGESYVYYYNMGMYKFVDKDYEEAIKLFETALKYKVPKNRYCLIVNNIGLSYVKLSEKEFLTFDEKQEYLDKAIEYYGLCLEKDPQNENASSSKEKSEQEKEKSEEEEKEEQQKQEQSEGKQEEDKVKEQKDNLDKDDQTNQDNLKNINNNQKGNEQIDSGSNGGGEI